jgi:hypothetical protein
MPIATISPGPLATVGPCRTLPPVALVAHGSSGTCLRSATVPSTPAALTCRRPIEALWTITAVPLALPPRRPTKPLRALAAVGVIPGPSALGAAHRPAATSIVRLTTGALRSLPRSAVAALATATRPVAGWLATNAAGLSRRLTAIALRRAAALNFIVVGHDTSISRKKRTSEMREGLLETE